MADRASFLTAIRANPADDTLRLVFADWLDERGDPLGEFIRVQLELDPIREQLDNPRAKELGHREDALLGTHGGEWLGAAADVADEFPAFGPVFRRGLPEMVCVSLDTFLARGGELFAACPTVREVCLFGVSDRGAELAACPDLAKVETLEISDPAYQDAFDDMAALVRAVARNRITRFRLPAESDRNIVHHLGREIAAGWPRWVEFVQYRPPLRTYPDQYATALDLVAGRPVASVVKLFDTTFPIAADVGHGLYPGVNDEGEPFLLCVRRDGTGLWVLFDREGRQDDAATFGEMDPAEVEDCRRSARSIRVREFEIGGVSLRLWPRVYVQDYLERTEPPAGGNTKEWWNRGGVLKRWLHQGRFVIEWDGHDYWADGTGTIFSS